MTFGGASFTSEAAVRLIFGLLGFTFSAFVRHNSSGKVSPGVRTR